MKAMTGTRWVGSEHNAVIAQIDIGSDEIAALGGNIERSNSDLGQVETAVFALEAGKVILLYRTERNPVRGFTLIVEGSDYSGVLDQFLREAGLGRERVTTELRS
jgi:hypothetical protein